MRSQRRFPSQFDKQMKMQATEMKSVSDRPAFQPHWQSENEDGSTKPNSNLSPSPDCRYPVVIGSAATSGITLYERGHWQRQIEFMLSCIGYSVGFGNIWRFPYLCLQNGGGAFLVPYLTYLIVCGMSLFFMETVIGQSTGLSTIRIFNMIPFFRGLGWCMVCVSGMFSIYGNVVIAYTLYYLAMSFNWILPWSHCENQWNTEQCFIPPVELNASYITQNNTLRLTGIRNGTLTTRSPAEEFWLFSVLELSADIETLGGIQWKLFGALLASWTITFACMYKGILSAGKVWIAAATQIFYSLGPAWGSLITFASYNKYNHNVLRDAIIIPVICGATSIYGGFAIYSVLGHQMYLNNMTDITEFNIGGPGLAFIAYPQALALLPGAAVWSVFFFLMLLTIGVDTQFATLEAVVTGLADQFPGTLGQRKITLTFTVCVVECLLGLILTTRAGFYYFMLFDSYTTSFSLLVIGFVEVLVIAYLYGSRRLLKDVEDMVGPLRRQTKLWWKISWWVLVPIMTLVIIANTIVSHFTEVQMFPTWAVALGWGLASLSLIHLPVMAFVSVLQHGCNWRKLFLPSEEWKSQVFKRRNARSTENT